MNVDRIPGGPDDPVSAAETPRSTDSPQPEKVPRPSPEPEHPSPPDQRQPPDREPESERESHGEQQEPESEHRPESPAPANEPDAPAPTDSPSHPTRDTPDTEDTAEPRSRQEHAQPPSTDRQEVSTEEDAVDREGSKDCAEEQPSDDSRADELTDQDGSRSDDARADDTPKKPGGGPPSQQDRPSEEGTERNAETQDQKTAERSDDASSSPDGPQPLSDKEWSEHVTEVRDGLDKARAAGLESHLLYTIDRDHQAWAKDRRALHDSIINEVYAAARDVPNQGHAVVAGGLGGAGKTTVLSNHANFDLKDYLIINPDNFKEEMAKRGMIPEIEGLSPMESSDLVHEESSYLARQTALRAQLDGKNIIWDVTMSTQESTEKRISDLRAAGYSRVDGLFIDIPIETSIKRTEARHREGHEQYRSGDGLGGRYLPPEVVERQEDQEWGSKNRKIFDSVKHSFDTWSIYDNSIDGRRAMLRESRTERN